MSLILNEKWVKKALKLQGIKGEHAYLEGAKDMLAFIEKELKGVSPEGAKSYINYIIYKQKEKIKKK